MTKGQSKLVLRKTDNIDNDEKTNNSTKKKPVIK